MTFSTPSSRPKASSIGSRALDPPAIQLKETGDEIVNVKVEDDGKTRASAAEVKPWAHLVAGG